MPTSLTATPASTWTTLIGPRGHSMSRLWARSWKLRARGPPTSALKCGQYREAHQVCRPHSAQRIKLTLTQLRGLEGVTLHNPLEINAATSKVGTTNSLAGVHDPERKSWVAVAPATPA